MNFGKDNTSRKKIRRKLSLTAKKFWSLPSTMYKMA